MPTPVALVTGATSGIGASTARLLRDHGYVVYGAGRRLERLKDLAGDGILTVELDVTSETSMTAAVEKIISQQGRIDVLVNNAGYGAQGAIEDTLMDEAREQLDVNVFGPMRLVQLVLPHMREQGSGRVINVTSIGGKVYSLLGGWYHGSKFALEALSDCLRIEVAPFGIHVSVIEPGAIATEWGTIAADNVERVSGAGAYRKDALAVAANIREFSATGKASPASVVAEAILSAATSPKPKTRYAVGRNARLILGVRRWASDRRFDAFARRSA